MFRPIIALVLSLLLAACGGGGDSGQPFIPPNISVTNGGANTTLARAYFDIYGGQDAMPLDVSLSVRTGSSPYPMNFEGGKICIREYGSTAACGQPGTVSARMPYSYGGDFVLYVGNLPSVRTLGWGQQLRLEIIVDNTPDPWYRGDTFTLWVTRVSYDFDLDTYTLDYSGASTTFSFGSNAPSYGVSSGDGQKKDAPPIRGCSCFEGKRNVALFFKYVYSTLRSKFRAFTLYPSSYA